MATRWIGAVIPTLVRTQDRASKNEESGGESDDKMDTTRHGASVREVGIACEGGEAAAEIVEEGHGNVDGEYAGQGVWVVGAGSLGGEEIADGGGEGAEKVEEPGDIGVAQHVAISMGRSETAQGCGIEGDEAMDAARHGACLGQVVKPDAGCEADAENIEEGDWDVDRKCVGQGIGDVGSSKW